MIEVIKTIRDVLMADAIIKSYCGDPARIYIVSKPVMNTAGTSYPQITINMEDGSSDTVTNVGEGTFFIHVWSKTVSGSSGGYTTGQLICKRIYELIDIHNFESATPKVYKIWRLITLPLYEDDTEVWHHRIEFDIVTDGYFDPEA